MRTYGACRTEVTIHHPTEPRSYQPVPAPRKAQRPRTAVAATPATTFADHHGGTMRGGRRVDCRPAEVDTAVSDMTANVIAGDDAAVSPR